MSFINKHITILLFFLSLLISITSYTQKKGYLKISGQVKSNKTKISNATVNLFEGTGKINSVITSTNGEFTFNLDFDKLYTIEIAASDYASKKVLVNTKISEKDLIYKYTFTVELFPKIEGVDYSALNKPVTKIVYNNDADAFDYDIPYTESMRKQIEQITTQIESVKKQSYNQIIAKADEKFKNQEYEDAITLYEKAIDIDPYNNYPDRQIMLCEKLIVQTRSKENNYNKYITQGDNLFNKQDYIKAKTAYQNASNIKPNETYPKTKLAEIDKLLAEKAAKEKAEAEAKAKEEQYKAAIAKADAFLENMKLSEAKSAYTEALKIKPQESYPKNKITEIENLIVQKEKKEQEIKLKEQNYKDAITKADKAFLSKDYTTAIAYYQTALKQKPNESYPKQKISECKELLKKRNEDEQKRLAEEKQRQIDEQQEKLKQLESINFNDKEEIQKYLSELARTYPEGVTEENYEDKTKKIKRIIVNKEGVANEYRQITHNWGGEFFFKNGQSISKSLFLIETKK